MKNIFCILNQISLVFAEKTKYYSKTKVNTILIKHFPKIVLKIKSLFLLYKLCHSR